MLISKDHLLHQLDGRPEDGWMSIKAVRSMIEDAPTIDEVIRCEHCKYNSNRHGNYVNCDLFSGFFGRTTDNYCSRAERE